MPIRAAVNQIDASVSSVPKHAHRYARHVEFHDRFADGKAAYAGHRFRDHGGTAFRRLGDGARRRYRLVHVLHRLRILNVGLDSGCRAVRHGAVVQPFGVRAMCGRLAVAVRRLMLLEPALVATQAFLDAQRCQVRAGIGIDGMRVGLEHDAGIEMDHALGEETIAFSSDGDVTGKTAVEIFFGRLGHATADARAQRFAHVDILARDT